MSYSEWFNVTMPRIYAFYYRVVPKAKNQVGNHPSYDEPTLTTDLHEPKLRILQSRCPCSLDIFISEGGQTFVLSIFFLILPGIMLSIWKYIVIKESWKTQLFLKSFDRKDAGV